MDNVSLSMIQMDVVKWAAFILVALIGGFASSLINNKGAINRIGWDNPDPTQRQQLKVGLIADLAAGVAAALGVLWTMTPQTFFQLIGIGAIAGYGGSSVLQALVNRLAADVSGTKVEKLEAEKKGLADWESKITKAEEELRQKKVTMSIMGKIAEAKKKQGSGG